MLASYSSPFILSFAIVIAAALSNLGVSSGTLRVAALGLALPLGLVVGRLLYMRRSMVEIMYDVKGFSFRKGKKTVSFGDWKDFKTASITVDSMGRSSLRLYPVRAKADHVEIPVSRTKADVQEFRDRVKVLLAGDVIERSSPQVSEFS